MPDQVATTRNAERVVEENQRKKRIDDLKDRASGTKDAQGVCAQHGVLVDLGVENLEQSERTGAQITDMRTEFKNGGTGSKIAVLNLWGAKVPVPQKYIAYGCILVLGVGVYLFTWMISHGKQSEAVELMKEFRNIKEFVESQTGSEVAMTNRDEDG